MRRMSIKADFDPGLFKRVKEKLGDNEDAASEIDQIAEEPAVEAPVEAPAEEAPKDADEPEEGADAGEIDADESEGAPFVDVPEEPQFPENIDETVDRVTKKDLMLLFDRVLDMVTDAFIQKNPKVASRVERCKRIAHKIVISLTKDKDLMADTGGITKNHLDEPARLPPRDDLKDRYRSRRKPAEMFDKDTDADPDALNKNKP